MLNKNTEVICLCSNEPMVKRMENSEEVLFYCRNCKIHIIVSNPKEIKSEKPKPTTKPKKKSRKGEIKLTSEQEQYLKQHLAKDFLQRFPDCKYTNQQLSQRRWYLLNISKGVQEESVG